MKGGRIAAIAYANIFVSNLDRAVAFYAGQLGFELLHQDSDHGYASLAAGPIHLGLAVPGDEQPELVGRHTGLGIAVDDLEAEHARLSSEGVPFVAPPQRQPWGGFMALIADPDGNVLYLDEVSAAHGGS